MQFLTREEFAAAVRAAAPVQPVDVPGIGRVGVLPMTGLDLEEHQAERERNLDDAEAMALMCKWIARLVCDDDKRPLFAGPHDDVLRSMPVSTLLDFGVAVLRAAAGELRDDNDQGEDDEGKA